MAQIFFTLGAITKGCLESLPAAVGSAVGSAPGSASSFPSFFSALAGSAPLTLSARRPHETQFVVLAVTAYSISFFSSSI